MATLFKKSIKVANRIDQIKRAVKVVSILNNIKISDTESVILTQFILEGFNKISREAIVTQKLVKNKQILDNCVSSLRSRGLIVKNGFKEELCEDLYKLRNANEKLALVILLDNSSK